MHFISAELSEEDDVHPFGPCIQFYKMFDFLRDLGYDHWLQYEPDVSPVQNGWGDRLLELAANNQGCRNWWQLGSVPMYPNPVAELADEDEKKKKKKKKIRRRFSYRRCSSRRS